MTQRGASAVQTAAMVLATLVLAHTLIFLAGYGATFGDAMAVTGHDHGWPMAAATALVLGATVLAATIWRFARLHRAAKLAGARPVDGEQGRGAFLRRWLAWWVGLTLATAFLCVLEENLELSRVGAHLPGIGVLASAAYPGATAVIGAVALLVSLLAALFGWKLQLLITRILALRAEIPPRAAPLFGRVAPVDRRLGSIIGRRLAGRAPPA